MIKDKDGKIKFLQKLIKLQEYKANRINIPGLYLKSYKNNKPVILKEVEY